MFKQICIVFSILLLSISNSSDSLSYQGNDIFKPIEVFDLEFVSSPTISPDGSKIIYQRNNFDIMTDRSRTNLWLINSDGSDNRPLTKGNKNYSSPVWSKDGSKLLYVSNEEGGSQLYLRWMDTGQTAKLTNLTASPGGLSWSPDGKLIAFTMFVKVAKKPFLSLPAKPNGAKWAKPPIYVDKIPYKIDGSSSFLPDGNNQIFVIPVEGGSPRQITDDEFSNGGGLSWTPDSKNIVYSSNRNKDTVFQPRNSDVFNLDIESGMITKLTDRYGPDSSPKVSPDGKKIVYTGYDDKHQGYQVSAMYVMDINGRNKKLVTKKLDRDIGGMNWSSDSKGVYFQYDTEGNTKIAFTDLNGNVDTFIDNVGGLSLGRPYGGGAYTTDGNGNFAYTYGVPSSPADLAFGTKSSTKKLTNLNDDLFGHKELGNVEEIWWKSSFDQRNIQGWIVTPPNFDSSKKYPFILEIHGGPFANYGDRFSAEVQLYAAAGYVVLYSNPRGSTSYGEEFGNLIHHDYPNHDYDDLMSGVDAVINKGYVDESQLFVTGGSGGGVLTSWIIGKTDRFRAAVVAKPVINWYSWVLTADMGVTGMLYWMDGKPWDNLEHYMRRSPISLIGNVKTPTMVLTGVLDNRTPMPESEQYFQALQIQKVESALVRIQESGHGIAGKPSNLIAKVSYIIAWFEKYKNADN